VPSSARYKNFHGPSAQFYEVGQIICKSNQDRVSLSSKAKINHEAAWPLNAAAMFASLRGLGAKIPLNSASHAGIGEKAQNKSAARQ
jgi:hypothetical protein